MASPMHAFHSRTSSVILEHEGVAQRRLSSLSVDLQLGLGGFGGDVSVSRTSTARAGDLQGTPGRGSNAGWATSPTLHAAVPALQGIRERNSDSGSGASSPVVSGSIKVHKGHGYRPPVLGAVGGAGDIESNQRRLSFGSLGGGTQLPSAISFAGASGQLDGLDHQPSSGLGQPLTSNEQTTTTTMKQKWELFYELNALAWPNMLSFLALYLPCVMIIVFTKFWNDPVVFGAIGLGTSVNNCFGLFVGLGLNQVLDTLVSQVWLVYFSFGVKLWLMFADFPVQSLVHSFLESSPWRQQRQNLLQAKARVSPTPPST